MKRCSSDIKTVTTLVDACMEIFPLTVLDYKPVDKPILPRRSFFEKDQILVLTAFSVMQNDRLQHMEKVTLPKSEKSALTYLKLIFKNLIKKVKRQSKTLVIKVFDCL